MRRVRWNEVGGVRKCSILGRRATARIGEGITRGGGGDAAGSAAEASMWT